LNTALQIATQLIKYTEESFSKFIVKLTIFAIALSVSAMIVSICMVQGFTLQIKDRIFGFWSHAEIVSNENNDNYEPTPINFDKKLFNKISKTENVHHISTYIIKSGIIKTKNEMEGIVLKGVDDEYDWSFMKKYLLAGSLPRLNKDSNLLYKDILISKSTASRLNVKNNDKLIIYFLNKGQSQPIGRKFNICGIYHTGLEEYDTKYAITDMHIIQQLNRWDKNMIHGYEIKVSNWKKLVSTVDKIYNNLLPKELYIYTIEEKYPNIFDWLTLQKWTSSFALILLLIIALFNMITALLLIILDKIKTIGILKALGANNWFIRKTFIYNAILTIGIGIFIGNILGLSLCLLQKYFGIIKMNEENYYFSYAPVEIQFLPILFINLIVIVIGMATLLIPSGIITKISPVKVLRFD
jgi:lipoprotein-releasing system permease protein